MCPNGRPITRQNLAREICGLFSNFHKVISVSTCLHAPLFLPDDTVLNQRYPISPGWEKWALMAGPEGIRVPDIVLFSLHYYRNVWVPELYVIG